MSDRVFADPLEEEFYTAFLRLGMRFGTDGTARFLKVVAELADTPLEVKAWIDKLCDVSLTLEERRQPMVQLLQHLGRLLKDDRYRSQIEEMSRRAIAVCYLRKSPEGGE
jgi:hypothetical protein